MVSYLAQTVLFQALFLGLYQGLLGRTTFYGWNRAYLLGSCLLSMMLPLVELELFRMEPASGSVFAQLPAAVVYLNEVELTSGASTWSGVPSWLLLWLFGALVFLLMLVRKLYILFRLFHAGERTPELGYTLVRLPENGDAFSFFRWVFLGSHHSQEAAQLILRHECVHIRQWHSLDLLVLELLRIPFWFNPLLWMYQRKLAEVHEFQADAQAIKQNKKAYYQQLLAQVFGVRDLSLVNPFYKHSSIKKRIVMIQKQSSRTPLKWFYALCIPLLFVMIGISSCEREPDPRPEANAIMRAETKAQLKAIIEQDESLSLEQKKKLFAKIEALSQNGASPVQSGSEKAVSGLANGELEVPFAVIEQVPIFPGCEDSEDPKACFNQKLQQHVMKHFNYPEAAQAQKIEGRVSVMFTIGTDGSIVDIKTRGPHQLLEAEVERIISRLPQMQPGLQEGKAVRVPFALPVVFKL